jgi:hypothetical protein
MELNRIDSFTDYMNREIYKIPIEEKSSKLDKIINSSIKKKILP